MGRRSITASGFILITVEMKYCKNLKFVLGLGIFILGLSLSLGWYFHVPTRQIDHAALDQLLASKELTDCKVMPTPFAGIYQIEGTHKVLNKTEKISINTHLDDAQLQSLQQRAGVKLDLPSTSGREQWINVILTLAVIGLLGGAIYYQNSHGKSRYSRVRQRPNVSLNDVAGVEEAKSEVQEIVDFLRHPKKYQRLGGTLPKGVLLIGPPGTGKTMLARAIAGEAKANFFSAHGSDFNEVFVGVGAKRVRQLFSEAAKHAPAIIFIDEIDCVGRNRKFDTNSENQQTINALLAAMDGFESSQGIVVIAATNRPEDLDDALMRPGRFDRKVLVPYPDMQGRRAILQTHADGKPIEEPLKALEVIAQTTPGMSGADLSNLLNEAAIISALQDASQITLADLETARDKVRFGKERKSMVLQKKEREMVAYHEAGHTLIHLQTTLMPPLYKVSIVPRGQTLGATTLLPQEDQNLQSQAFLMEELVVLMGGRAAEKVFYGSTTNGASGDLDMARKIACKMIHEWGMGEKLYYEPKQRDAEAEINHLLESADRQALTIIQDNKEKTEKLANALLTQDTLTREAVLELLEMPTAANC